MEGDLIINQFFDKALIVSQIAALSFILRDI